MRPLRPTGLTLIGVLLVLALGPGGPLSAEAAESTGRYVSVQDAWARAEVHHPAVVEAEKRVASAERDVLQREAAYAPALTAGVTGLSLRVSPDGTMTSPEPVVSLNASLKLKAGVSLSGSLSTRSTEGSGGGGGTGVGSFPGGESLRGSVSFTYPLFRSAALDGDALSLQQGETNLVAAVRELEHVRDEVRADVLTALHQEQGAALRLELALEAYDEAEAAAEKIRRRVGLGVAPETDLIGARIDLLRAEKERIQATRTWQNRRHELLTMLGLDGEPDDFVFQSVQHWTRMPDPPALEEALSGAIQRSVTLWERMQAEEVAATQLEAERRRFRGDINLTGSYNSRNSGSNQSPGWQVGVGVTYPLLDGGQRERTLQSREEAYEGARQGVEDARRAVEEQVEDGFIQLADARRDVEIAELELLRARLELESVQRQAALPVAVVGEDELRQGERALVRAEQGWREAVQTYQMRWIALQRLIGPVDWTRLIGEDEAPEEGAR